MKPLFGSRIYLFLKTLQVKGDMQIIHLQDKLLRTSPKTLRGLTGPGCASQDVPSTYTPADKKTWAFFLLEAAKP